MILFQGDSITDSGRSYKDNENLGTGYVMIAVAWISAVQPDKNLRFLNRGISGNRIRELKNRWQKDCLDLKPHIVSILIGVNDALSNRFWKKPTPIENFENDYRSILEQTRDVLGAQTILLEPFVLHVTKENLKLREILNPKIEVVRNLSKEFNTLLIPLDRIFTEATEKRNSSYWSQDGIHPTLAGHALIAKHWLEKVTCNST